MTLALLNNNLLNVKQPFRGGPWYGSTIVEPNGHAHFLRDEFCFCAATRIFARKWELGARSILDFIGGDPSPAKRWSGFAPASDTLGSIPGQPNNNPIAYSLFIATATKLHDILRVEGPSEAAMTPIKGLFTDELAVSSVYESLLARIFRAMVRYESFDGLRIPMEPIESGIALYGYRNERGAYS